MPLKARSQERIKLVIVGHIHELPPFLSPLQPEMTPLPFMKWAAALNVCDQKSSEFF